MNKSYAFLVMVFLIFNAIAYLYGDTNTLIITITLAVFALVLAWKIDKVQTEIYRTPKVSIEMKSPVLAAISKSLAIQEAQEALGTEKEGLSSRPDTSRTPIKSDEISLPSEMLEESPIEKMKKLREKYEKKEQEKPDNQQN